MLKEKSYLSETENTEEEEQEEEDHQMSQDNFKKKNKKHMKEKVKPECKLLTPISVPGKKKTLAGMDSYF